MPAEHRPPPDHLVSNQRSKRKQEPQGGGQKGDCQRRTETDEAKVQNLVWLIVCALRIMVGTHKHREDGPEQSEDAAHANVRCTEQERSRCRGASRDPFEEAIHPKLPIPVLLVLLNNIAIPFIAASQIRRAVTSEGTAHATAVPMIA
jgi:hypothetical protein